jgi:hypothetical protein
MKSFNLSEVQKINEWLQNINVEQVANDPYTLHEISIRCATYKAFCAEQMAIAKKDWHDAKITAYNTFLLSNEANRTRVEQFGVMVIKDYIASKCGSHESIFLYCERTGNACGEMSDVCRTVISSLKELTKAA